PGRAEVAGGTIVVRAAGGEAAGGAANVTCAGQAGSRLAGARPVTGRRWRVRRAGARLGAAGRARREELAGPRAVAHAVVTAGGRRVLWTLVVRIGAGGDRFA